MHNDTPLVPMQLPREVIEYCERTGITHALIAMCFMSIKVGDADHGIFISPDIEVYPRLVGDTDHRQPVYGAKKLTGDLRQSRGYPGLIQEYGCVNKRCIVLGPKGDIEAGDTIFRTLMDIKTGIVMVGHNTIATVFEKVTAHSIGANGFTEDMLLISLQSSREDPTGIGFFTSKHAIEFMQTLMRGGASHVAAIQKITQHFPLEPAMRVSMDGDESLRRDGYFYRMRQTTCNVVVDPNDGGKSKGLCPSDAVRQDPVGTGFSLLQGFLGPVAEVITEGHMPKLVVDKPKGTIDKAATTSSSPPPLPSN